MVVVFFIAALVAKPYTVTGDSKKSTLKNGQKNLINKLAYLNNYPRRSYIIVTGVANSSSNNKSMIRRIVGLPGKTVEIRKGKVFINNQILGEPYLDKNQEYDFDEKPGKTDATHYFLLADNRRPITIEERI